MSQTQTTAAPATEPATVADTDWKIYDGHIPPMLLRMCRGSEVKGPMLHKAMANAKNFIPSESHVPEAEVNGPWRAALVCGWGTPGNRIMILVPYRDRPDHGIEVRTKGDVTDVNVHVALRALAYGLARAACEAMDAK